jgi:hypothetical protein
MKSRRRIAFPEAQDHADDVRLQQGVAADEMGVGGQFARQQPDEISRKRRQSVIGAFCPPKSDYNVLSLDKSLFLQSLLECRDDASGLVGRPTAEKTDYRHHCLLGMRGKRPCGCRTSNCFDEIASSHCRPGLAEIA